MYGHKLVSAAFSFAIVDLVLAIEPFVVGGNYTNIKAYPHAAFIFVSCDVGDSYAHWLCGSSIVNQNILLTAAHCLEYCSLSTMISVAVGNEDIDKAYKTIATKYLIHENYDTLASSNDIALILVKSPLPLSSNIQRVVIMRRAPYDKYGFVSGWGFTDRRETQTTNLLKDLKQKVWSYTECRKVMPFIPKGVLCGGERGLKTNFVMPGDSGGALMMRKYIQIGILSHKTFISESLVVYTNVSYFYDWIKKSAVRLHCSL